MVGLGERRGDEGRDSLVAVFPACTKALSHGPACHLPGPDEKGLSARIFASTRRFIPSLQVSNTEAIVGTDP